MLERTVCVMHISMQNHCTVTSYMSKLHGHSLNWTIEDTRIVHIVPDKEQARRTFELIKLLFPKDTGIFVQEVHEC